MSEGPGRIDRSKDLYRVHDSSKKQKKERKTGDEKEFMELLEESGRDLGEFKEEKQKPEQRPQIPTKSLLNKLSNSAPPLFEIIDESDAGNEGEKNNR